jgi:hypothetical protein
MKRQHRPTTYMTTDELLEMATIRRQEAAITPEGSQQKNILREAQVLQYRAQLRATQRSERRARTDPAATTALPMIDGAWTELIDEQKWLNADWWS